MPQIVTRVSDELADELDKLVANGVFASRSAAVRSALEQAIAQREREEIDRAIVEGYTKFPPGDDFDEWIEDSGLEMVEEEPW